MGKPISSKELKIIEEIRSMYATCGSEYFDSIDTEVNTFYKSNDGKTYIVTYWDIVNALETPNGHVPVLGNRLVGGGELKILPSVIKKFGLVKVSETNRDH